MSMNSMDQGGCSNKFCHDTQHSVATVHLAIGITLEGLIDAIYSSSFALLELTLKGTFKVTENYNLGILLPTGMPPSRCTATDCLVVF